MYKNAKIKQNPLISRVSEEMKIKIKGKTRTNLNGIRISFIR